MSDTVYNNFLASLIAQPRGGAITNNNTYRRYATSVRTSANVGHVNDERMHRILYEVGRANNTLAECLTTRRDGLLYGDASYQTNAILTEDFVGLAKKYTNFSANFKVSSLGGVVERIACGLAAFSVYGSIESQDLLGGAELSISALGRYDGPVNALNNTVFIPRLVDDVITPDVFSVLIHAVGGEGSSVATDILELDVATKQPIVPNVANYDFARSAVEALRILGANMIESDQGPLFALACTRGIHKVVSVVGHTDEGAVHRDLLRCGGFGPPFGGIHYGLHEYAGLPSLNMSGMREISAFVDALALSTAALVAHCDPGMEYDGKWYPTFYDGSSVADNFMEPGQTTAPGPNTLARNRSALLNDYPRFLKNYVKGLEKVFGATGEYDAAIRFQSAMARNLSTENCRHVNHTTITPHYWIEPTSIIPHDFLGTEAEVEGFGSLGGKLTQRRQPAWEYIEANGIGTPAFSSYLVKMRSARTSWFLHHWNNHPENGLGSIVIRQMDPSQIIQPGGASNQPVRERLMNGASLGSYLWTRGQSCFCAPGELMSLGSYYGIYVRHTTYDDEGYATMEHVPNSEEFENLAITISVGLPTGIMSGASNTYEKNVKRAKTKAARELAAATVRMRLYGRADATEMPISMSNPTPRARGLELKQSGERSADGKDVPQGTAGTDHSTRDTITAGPPHKVIGHDSTINLPTMAGGGGAQQRGGGIVQTKKTLTSDDLPLQPLAIAVGSEPGPSNSAALNHGPNAE